MLDITDFTSSTMSERTATVERKTSETEISCTLNLDYDPSVGKQVIDVQTGIGFLDHVSHRCAQAH